MLKGGDEGGLRSPSGIARSAGPAKRAFDVFFSILGLLILSPILLVAGVLIKLESKGPILFRQVRIGKDFTPFTLYKLRTMRVDPASEKASLSCTQKHRITRVGRILRATKLDELPQLFNVLKGEMSMVGPRPEAKEYVDLFRETYRNILRVRPGITDPASILYRNEERLLATADDAERMYREQILPRKLRMNLHYLERASLSYDLWLILRTTAAVLFPSLSGEEASD
jgi:lipopolysaccharide/colanic/teichoic acid biosynthesis glycosyltransferase